MNNNNKKRNLEEIRNIPSYIAQPNSEHTIYRKKDNEIIHVNPIQSTGMINKNPRYYYEYKSIETKKEYLFVNR